MSTYRHKATGDLLEAQQWVPNAVIDGVTRYTDQDGNVIDRAYIWVGDRNVDIETNDWVVWDKRGEQYVMKDEDFQGEFEDP